MNLYVPKVNYQNLGGYIILLFILIVNLRYCLILSNMSNLVDGDPSIQFDLRCLKGLELLIINSGIFCLILSTKRKETIKFWFIMTVLFWSIIIFLKIYYSLKV